MCHTRFVFQRLLDELKWGSKGKYSLNRIGWSNLHVIESGFRNIVTGRQIPEALRHVRKSVVCLKKTARLRIDKGYAARHVRQNLFVKDDFAFDTLPNLHLPLIKSGAKPREDRCENNQPRRQDGHSSEQIVNRFIGQASRLLDYGDPTGRFDRAEGIKISLPLEMPALALPDLFEQNPALGGMGVGIGLEITVESRFSA